MNKNLVLAAAAVFTFACTKEAPPAAEPEAAPEAFAEEAVEVSVYVAAVANPSRLEGDYARDAGRKPAEVMEFFGVEPGQTVLDMFSGGGYYSDLLSYVVGPEGRVDAHSNEAYLNFVGDEFKARHAEGRLNNVQVLWAENNELQLAADEYDVIMLVLSFHDIYYANPERGWPQIDGPKLLAELYKGLKPGGVIGVVDHAAAAGSPRETGGTVHRIDPAIVLEEMTATGLVLDAESDILRNPDDDYSKSVFDETLRRRTDRFVLRFRKPPNP